MSFVERIRRKVHRVALPSALALLGTMLVTGLSAASGILPACRPCWQYCPTPPATSAPASSSRFARSARRRPMH